ncbi:MAG: BON domain-containing protein [Parachlamydiaceae bacterium]|nr:BON domain-containing protein [Parachlamydiaceae bacterium]
MKTILLLIFLCFFCVSSHFADLEALLPTASTKNVPMRTDADISRAVRGAFAADKFIAAESVGVSVQMENGIATLSGTVSTERAKNEIGAKARGVGGVRQVVNNIQVQVTGVLPKSPTGPKLI